MTDNAKHSQETVIEARFTDSIWQFFASIRLTVVALLSLAAFSIIGTLIPQNQSPGDYLGAFGSFGARLLFTLHIHDMYHSWWFLGLIIMLTVNIIVCSIDRLQTTWPVLFPKNGSFSPEHFRHRKSRLTFDVADPKASLQSDFERIVRKSFRRCRTEPADKGFVISLESGRWTRFGVYAVHLSVVLLLIGAFIGSKFGFEGFVTINEGQSADAIELRHTGQVLVLPFTIRCNDFDVQFYEGTNRPKEFRSKLSLLENGRVVLERDIIVNAPLRYKGINIFQSSYGQASFDATDESASARAPGEVALTFQSAASGMIYTITGTMGRPLELPEEMGTFVLKSYEPEAVFKETALGPALSGMLHPKLGDPVQVLLPLRFPRFDAMRGGSVIISASDAAVSSQKRYYTGLQVTHDPGVGMVYAGFLVMIAGCVVTFFMSHQRAVVEVRFKRSSAQVLVAGTANKAKDAFQTKLARLGERLAACVGGETDNDAA